MYQYFCKSCNEPVSQKFDRPVLEDEAIVICRSCVENSTISTPVIINLERRQDMVMLDALMANELAAQFKEKI